ncbi:MAG TPA: glycosyltransferase [Phycisphaerae bacterium]|nr:glycosyltransferase [Phycisphaerae bacterium]
MRILHIVQSLDPAWGGIARVLPCLASELAAAGDACRIATLTGGRFGAPPDVPGVEVLRFDCPSGSRLGTSREFNSRIADLVRDTDVVHLHGLWTGQNWSAGKAARKSGRPYIVTPHSMMMPWAWQRSWWKKRPVGWLFEHKNLRQAARLHALAEAEADHMRTLGFNDRIEVIPNGLRTSDFVNLPPADGLIDRFPEMRDRRWVVFLGRIHPQKGIVQAMQACFDLLAFAGDWHLIIAGPDEIGLAKTLQAAIARKNLQNRVTFTGMLNREDVLALLGHATLLLQPSMSEGLSMSILEALAAGVPAVISTACNMPEVETEGAGRVVPPNRADLAYAMRGMVKLSKEALAEMGRKARKLAEERFDWAKLIPKYRAMYAKVAGP